MWKTLLSNLLYQYHLLFEFMIVFFSPLWINCYGYNQLSIFLDLMDIWHVPEVVKDNPPNKFSCSVAVLRQCLENHWQSITEFCCPTTQARISSSVACSLLVVRPIQTFPKTNNFANFTSFPDNIYKNSFLSMLDAGLLYLIHAGKFKQQTGLRGRFRNWLPERPSR